MNNSYVWGGAVAGLIVIAALGVLLLQRSGRIREALAPYIGEQPAKWMIYAAWFAYAYSVVVALAQVVTVLPMFALDENSPSAISFGYGAISQAILPFLNALIPVAHLVALVTAGVLLYRHLKARAV